MVPLRPRLNQLAVTVDDEDAVLKARLALGCRGPKRPKTPGVTCRRFLRNGKFAALKNVNPVGRLGEDAALRPPGPSRVSERLRPAGYNLIGTGFVLPSLFLGRGDTLQSASEQNQNAYSIANAQTVIHLGVTTFSGSTRTTRYVRDS